MKNEFDRTESRNYPFKVVVIGASAGGVEALEKFFTAMSEVSGCAFVVVQHLSPDFKSYMSDILSRKTQMNIVTINEDTKLQRDTLYLLPPKKNLIFENGFLKIVDIDRKQGLNKPIDIFFKSISKPYGRRVAGVIFSGTGSDGSEGIKAIKKCGGQVFVESPESAKFSGMPDSAIATNIVDFVGEPKEIADAVQSFSRGSSFDNVNEKESSNSDQTTMEKIFHLIHEHFRVDFGSYKEATIERRLEKRIQELNLESEEEYLEVIKKNPDEVSNLYQEMLIGVTRFFRDPESFNHLKSDILPKIVQSKKRGEEIRFWVAGCASGQEVYSLLILLHEEIQKQNRLVSVKIFASDIDEVILNQAAEGIYSKEDLDDILLEYKEKYFLQLPSLKYQITPELRKNVVFTRHNLLTDPPFSRLDLVACRNLLIYFKDDAQKRALTLFYFSLNENGYLFLGPSENLGSLKSGFNVLDRKWKTFRKIRSPLLNMEFRSNFLTIPTKIKTNILSSSKLPIKKNTNSIGEVDRAFQKLLQEYVPPSLLINEELFLIHVFGNAGRFLKQKAGTPQFNLKHMLDDRLLKLISTAILRVKKNQERITVKEVREDGTQDSRFYVINASILKEKNQSNDLLYLVTIDEEKNETTKTDTNTSLRLLTETEKDDQVKNLEIQLQETKEDLQATVEELEVTNEELQSTNEELLASNEELQSTNEELQSVNEELFTVNSEYQNKIDELVQLSNDEASLLKSAEISAMFVDHDLNIRKFTPKVAEIFQIMEQDVGRPIDHFTHNLVVEDLVELLKSTIESRSLFEREVKTKNGRNLLLRIAPYLLEKRQIENQVGAVIAFVDITKQKSAEFEMRSFFDISLDALMILELDGTVVRSSPSVNSVLGYSQIEVQGKNFLDFVHPDFEIELKTMLSSISNNKKLQFEFKIKDPRGFSKWISMSARYSPDYDHIYVNARDVTHLKETVFQLMYVSEESKALNGESGIKEILTEANERNVKEKITGVLLYTNGFFIQLLEGDQEKVEALYKEISEDKRHKNVHRLFGVDGNKRLYSQWSMGYRKLTQEDETFIESVYGLKKIINSNSDTKPDPYLILHMLDQFRKRMI